MFSFLKKKSPEVVNSPTTDTCELEPIKPALEGNINLDEPVIAVKKSLLSRFRVNLTKTRHKFTDQVANLLLGKKVIDQALLDELETLLISADLGMEATQIIIKGLTQNIARKALTNPDALWDALRRALIDILTPCQKRLDLSHSKPAVFLMIGINGAGKTTTIGKLSHYLKAQGLNVMLAAGDTFRAAAVEQLQAWGARNQLPVIAQQTGADSASVLFDAVTAAKARHSDVLLADTAGRLHNKDHLMEELKKIKRVLGKAEPGAPHEICLVLDAGIGQNGLVQLEKFHQALGVTSLILTKLDGTAKGGIIFAIAEKFKLPIYFIGVGEHVDDLRPFNAIEFVDGLLPLMTL